jgi:hypothetical protein
VNAHEPADVARLREAFASLNGGGPDDPVAADRIFDALHGQGTADERQAVVDQLVVNPAAMQAWRLARDMAADAASHPWTLPAAWKWMSVAAAAMLVVALGWQVIPLTPAEEPVYRRVETRTIASALPADAALERAHPVLRWTGIEGARYRVRVFTSDLQLLEESAESTAPEHRLSQALLQRLDPATPILWHVEARRPGEAVVVSPTFRNRMP